VVQKSTAGLIKAKRRRVGATLVPDGNPNVGEVPDEAERDQGGDSCPSKALWDVFPPMMSNFVGEDCFQFRLGELCDQGIVEHDLSEFAEPGEEGVRVP
jgi:hypothetical protein